ncbi:MAG: DNA-directed RNA polymerase subunit K/omega [bacterium]|jgi:DNA-directed RNA polymerase subunit K/omega
MNYLDFIEGHKTNRSYNLFEKVLIAKARAKDLYDGKTTQLVNIENRKKTAVALYELSHDYIQPLIRDASEVEVEPEFENFDEEE